MHPGLLALWILAAAAPQGERPGPVQAARSRAAEASDEEVRAALRALAPERRAEIAEHLRAELDWVEGFQAQLLEHALSLSERPPEEWPLYVGAPIYDPKVHAPKLPIARKQLPDGHPGARKVRERAFRKVPERNLASGWIYDWRTREPRRLGPLHDAERELENALAGFRPLTDLAEVLVLRALDRGEEQVVLGALSHAYADREGNVFPGITLYDAWASSEVMEMPDVEVLGVVHDVWDDWKSWVSPIPGSQQRALYQKVEELFLVARDYRAPREALARAYAIADPVMRDAMGPHVDRFHALWESVSSTPAALAERLPAAQGWGEWLASEGRRIDRSRELWEAGQVRKRALLADQAAVRAALLRVLRSEGVLPR